MTGGDGTYSYAKNFSFQREGISNSKSMIDETIAQNLQIKPSNTFRIADLGCSVGPGAVTCAENIIQAVKLKYHDHETPEFQVFFNDHTFNDFNTLFRCLPLEKTYFAAGVPGSFHERLFPENSIYFVHSSHALHWLSRVPKELLDTNTPSWNQSRSAPGQVIKAYAGQFAKDVEIFLNVRAKELVEGGIMVLILPPSASTHASALSTMMFDALGSCLMDMAKEGKVSESLVNSFNLPMYLPSPEEMLEVVESNGCFKIEKIEMFHPSSSGDMITNGNSWKTQLRTGMEGLLSKHFGNEIMDELFDLFPRKIEQVSFQHRATLTQNKKVVLFLALKRK
ncbi:S-adenosyl-L-methionine-dependent methyltransferases superfamily protein [Euphorbia peplus]|nr:S-adenosyl-L-methionine-dependent methyltransferases superfamily protein [Euphorbia peplus]